MKKQSEQGRTWKNRIRKSLRSERAMTLTEMLAALLILSMTAVAIGGGVVAVKNAYQKTTEKAEAQQVLASTAQLMTSEFSAALDEEDGENGSPQFISGSNGNWLRFVSSPEAGICKEYLGTSEADKEVPLLSVGAMADRFYTDFESCTFQDACFVVRNLAVYYKTDADGQDQIPAALLPELRVRAVNLEP